jgi:hypothetical protein
VTPPPRRRQLLVGLPTFLSGMASLGAQATRSSSAPRLLCGEWPPLTDEPGLTQRVARIARVAGCTEPAQRMPWQRAWQRAWQEAQAPGNAIIHPLARTPERVDAGEPVGRLRG